MVQFSTSHLALDNSAWLQPRRNRFPGGEADFDHPQHIGRRLTRRRSYTRHKPVGVLSLVVARGSSSDTSDFRLVQASFWRKPASLEFLCSRYYGGETLESVLPLYRGHSSIWYAMIWLVSVDLLNHAPRRRLSPRNLSGARMERGFCTYAA